MAAFRTLDDLDVAERRVLVRVDLNLPLHEGRVTDTTRIDRLLPTLHELRRRRARVLLLSHFGRPKGKPVPELSLRPVLPALAEALGAVEIAFAPDCIGAPAAAVAGAVAPGGIALFENLRFHPGEESNDPDFARALAANGELYVNDAFSCAHRAHASVAAITRLLPAAAGRLMEAEIAALTRVLDAPQRPVAAIIGGAKVSTKLDLLGHLSAKVDMLAIGGAMANTFLYALGAPVGIYMCERDMADTARAVLETAKDRGCEVVLPTDAVIAPELKAGAETRTVAIADVPADAMILDIGPETAGALAARLAACRTLLWNGPLGAFEVAPFDAGTMQVARAAAALTGEGRLLSVAGGGDTVAALRQAGVADDFSYISTAGGAFLEWLEGKTLPGVAALERAAA